MMEEIVQQINDLRLELKFYKKLFESTRTAIAVVNMDGHFIDVNLSFLRLLNHTKAVMLEKPFISFVHPDDVCKTIEAYEEIKQGADLLDFTNRYSSGNVGGEYTEMRWECSYLGDCILCRVSADPCKIK